MYRGRYISSSGPTYYTLVLVIITYSLIMLTYARIIQLLTILLTIYLGIVDIKTIAFDRPTITEVKHFPLKRSKSESYQSNAFVSLIN